MHILFVFSIVNFAQFSGLQVRRVLGAEAVKLREELGSFRQKKRAFEEQQKAALMVKQQQVCINTCKTLQNS